MGSNERSLLSDPIKQGLGVLFFLLSAFLGTPYDLWIICVCSGT